jgi:hypothetical protein
MLPLFLRRVGRRSATASGVLLSALALLAFAPAAARADGIMVADCKFSHRAPDDPIVFHGMPSWSHMHDFFGNSSTNASSTFASLRRSAGNCAPVDDRSAYWTPTLYWQGRPRKPIQVQAYYQDFFRHGRVLPFPPGLRMVAGRPAAKAPQRGIVRWTCQDDHGRGAAKLPACGSRFVTLRIAFPDCWDGRRLDSPDHRSHMAYNRGDGMELGPQRCPATHPVVVPQLQLNVVYPIHDGEGVMLASGSVLTAHADFFNGWKPSILRQRVDDILNGGKACDDYLGCATISAPNTEPVTARPKAQLIDRFYRRRSGSRHGHQWHRRHLRSLQAHDRAGHAPPATAPLFAVGLMAAEHEDRHGRLDGHHP